MINKYCCEDCHDSDGACTYCLGINKKNSFNKDIAIHLGYVSLHLIQMILIIGLVK
jgi:hypothetical protein